MKSYKQWKQEKVRYWSWDNGKQYIRWTPNFGIKIRIFVFKLSWSQHDGYKHTKV